MDLLASHAISRQKSLHHRKYNDFAIMERINGNLFLTPTTRQDIGEKGEKETDLNKATKSHSSALQNA